MLETWTYAQAPPPLGGALDMRDGHPAMMTGVVSSEVSTPHRQTLTDGDLNGCRSARRPQGSFGVLWTHLCRRQAPVSLSGKFLGASSFSSELFPSQKEEELRSFELESAAALSNSNDRSDGNRTYDH